MLASMTIALLLAGPARAQEEPGFQKKVSITVRRVPLGVFLDALSAQAKVNFVVADSLEDKTVTAYLHDVSVTQALDTIREMKGVDYRRVGETSVYLVLPKDSPYMYVPAVLDNGEILSKRVSIVAKKVSLSRFLEALSGQTHANFSIEDGLETGKVTAYLKGVTAREALEVVLSSKGLGCRRIGSSDTYLVQRPPKEEEPPPAPAAPPENEE
ncbi:MAG: hypothetical protein HY079_10610 [Elusimicrobia bacterium]|nr:hypothetical protein [Elusimicrobiota bacterium]